MYESKEVKINFSTVDDPVLQTSLKTFQYAKKKGVLREALEGIINMVSNHTRYTALKYLYYTLTTNQDYNL